MIFLKRTSPKPYPTKGPWVDMGNLPSPATRAAIIENPNGFYEVNVWELKYDTQWNESSYSGMYGYLKLESEEAAKKWLVENYGGRWCKGDFA